jgi:hypothetical protein
MSACDAFSHLHDYGKVALPRAVLGLLGRAHELRERRGEAVERIAKLQFTMTTASRKNPNLTAILKESSNVYSQVSHVMALKVCI